MKISVAVVIILISACIVNASLLDPVIENVVHRQATKLPSGVSGVWKKKTIWKPRWVKEWKSAKVMKPVWRKIWSPVQIKEWVPIPKPPPGWDTMSTPLVPVKTSSQTSPPLWDPVPYPESQQPPPPPPPPSPPIFTQGDACGPNGCGDSSAFNQQQISAIIGSHTHGEPPGYSQGAEYSETVNHLTRVPPNGNRWTPPNQSNFRFNNGFFQDLPSFLVPPKFQPLPGNHVPLNNQNIQRHPQNNQPSQVQITQSQELKVNQNHNNGLHQWTALPTQNIKGHFITKAPDQPIKIPLATPQIPVQNSTLNRHGDNLSQKPNPVHLPHIGSDFIQPAELVSEYHYSEFDLHQRVKPDAIPRKQEPQQNPIPQMAPEGKGKTEDIPQSKPLIENKPRPVRTGPQQSYPLTAGQFQYSLIGPLQHFQQPSTNNLPQQHFVNLVQQPVEPPQIKGNSEHTNNSVHPQNPPNSTPLKPTQVHFAFFEPKPQEKPATTEIFPIYINTKDHQLHPTLPSEKENAIKPFLLNENQSKHSQSPSLEIPKSEIKFIPLPTTPEPVTKETTPEKENEIIEKEVTTQYLIKSVTETTTPFTVYPSSSATTTEAVTQSPVYVVTPIYVAKT